MQPKQPQQIPGWMKTWMGWPRWAQVTSLIGLMVLLTAGWMLAGAGADPQPNASDPFKDPALLMASVFLKLVIVVLIMIAALWLLRRIQGGGWKATARQVQVLETTHLSPRRAIHLIQIGDRKLLIGATDQSVSLLTEIDDQPIESGDPSATFADLLAESAQPVEMPGRS
jgi:flagellar biosynthetic protein FliO